MSESAGAAALSSAAGVLGGYRSGYKLVAGVSENSVERFAVLSTRGMPRLLLPLPHRAMRAALDGFVGSRGWFGIAPPLIRAASKFSSRRFSLSTELSLCSDTGAQSPLRELLSSVLGRDDFHLALRLSFGRPNAKTVVAAISDKGEMLCFAKLGSESMTNDLVAHESRVLEQFASSDSPVIVPRKLYADRWDGGGNILVTEPLQLEPLLQQAPLAHRAADALATSGQVATTALRDSAHWRQMVARVEALGESGGQGDAMSAVAEIDATWGDEIFDFGASHGDWSFANVGLVDGRVAAIDWERYSELAPRGLDLAHFSIIRGSSRARRRSLDIEQVAQSTRQCLAAAGRPVDHAKPLIMLDFLEMIVRFMEARKAGLQTADSKFEPAFRAGLRNWAA